FRLCKFSLHRCHMLFMDCVLYVRKSPTKNRAPDRFHAGVDRCGRLFLDFSYQGEPASLELLRYIFHETLTDPGLMPIHCAAGQNARTHAEDQTSWTT